MPLTSEDMAEYMKARRLARRISLIELLGGKCAECGSTESLEVNHVDRENKSFQLSGANLDRSWDTILEEAGKCNLLCSEHHKEFTRKQYTTGSIEPWNKSRIQDTRELFGIPHGSAKRYNEAGCRCDHCRLAKRLYRTGLAKFSEIVSPPATP